MVVWTNSRSPAGMTERKASAKTDSRSFALLRKTSLYGRGIRQMMRWLWVLAVIGWSGLAYAAGGVDGDWKSATGSVVRVYSCGAESCVKIVKLERELREALPGSPYEANLQREIARLEKERKKWFGRDSLPEPV